MWGIYLQERCLIFTIKIWERSFPGCVGGGRECPLWNTPRGFLYTKVLQSRENNHQSIIPVGGSKFLSVQPLSAFLAHFRPHGSGLQGNRLGIWQLKKEKRSEVENSRSYTTAETLMTVTAPRHWPSKRLKFNQNTIEHFPSLVLYHDTNRILVW